MRILGIDPGIAIVGFGLIEADRGRTRLLNYGAITTPAGLPLARRLVQIEQDMEALIAQLKPDAIAVEELFFSNNITTGIAVAHGRGIILCTAEKSGVPLYEYTPMQVKQAVVGYGLAEKKTGHGHGQAALEAQGRAAARRCCRCAGHCHLPRAQRHVAPEPRGRERRQADHLSRREAVYVLLCQRNGRACGAVPRRDRLRRRGLRLQDHQHDNLTAASG